MCVCVCVYSNTDRHQCCIQTSVLTCLVFVVDLCSYRCRGNCWNFLSLLYIYIRTWRIYPYSHPAFVYIYFETHIYIRAYISIFTRCLCVYSHVACISISTSQYLQSHGVFVRIYIHTLLLYVSIFTRDVYICIHMYISIFARCLCIHTYISIFTRCLCLYLYSLRVVGSLKWQVSFAEYRLFYRALLQKRPIILYIHTECIHIHTECIHLYPHVQIYIRTLPLYPHVYIYIHTLPLYISIFTTSSRLLKMTGLFCRISSLL